MTEKEVLLNSLKLLKTLDIDGNHEKFVFDFICKQFEPLGYVRANSRIEANNLKGKGYTKLIISNPNGGQNSPDIHIVNNRNDVFVAIESKSSNKNNAPTWNGGRVKSKTIYIFSKKNDTTYFLDTGTTLNQFYAIVDGFMKHINPIVDAMNKHIKAVGLLQSFYLRHMYNDRYDYLGSGRLQREQDVETFINSL